MSALAFLLTFSTYGTHLHGCDKGSVDFQHCIPGSPMLPAHPGRATHWESRLRENPWIMSEKFRLLTLESILGVCKHRSWIAHAIHVRTNHVHAVISGSALPERMLSTFKAYATRRFRSAPLVRQRYWTSHGSTRYLWNEASCSAAIEYVLNQQGETMACYQHSKSAQTEPEALATVTKPKIQG